MRDDQILSCHHRSIYYKKMLSKLIQYDFNVAKIQSFFNLSKYCKEYFNRVDVGSYPQHLSLHRTYGSRIRRYIHIGERKL